jgi:hypothetical protein
VTHDREHRGDGGAASVTVGVPTFSTVMSSITSR